MFFPAVTLLEYCRHGVKQKTINPSIDLFVFSLADRDVCFQPQVVGPCEALAYRYWYNSRTMRCELFEFGGCGGNENNFETLQECQRRCSECFIIAINEYLESIYDTDAFYYSMFHELMNWETISFP